MKSDDIDDLGGQAESLPTQEARIEILSRENAVRAKYIASLAGGEN